MKKNIPFILFFLFFINSLWAQEDISNRTLQAERITDLPKIDGRLDDACWKKGASFDGYFTQTSPNNGVASAERTQINIRYTDFAIYVGAMLFDSEPDKIRRELGFRDESGKNTDLFAIGFDTYNQGQNAFIFQVTAAGAQVDIFLAGAEGDISWNAVWKSGVQTLDNGWSVEMEIPYSALRFPRQEVQTWGMNFLRNIKRKEEEAFWNFVDANKEGVVNQSGTLTGIKNIKPPLRLQLTPYISLARQSDLDGNWTNSLSGGADLKYGISESFTLDMSLVPDFGQVISDKQVLNLTPFEVRFEENRQFFTEGTEIFNKGNIFYTRRIGRSWAGEYEVNLKNNEELKSTPSEAPLLNATKVSGRNKKGLGLGFFNALTSPTYFNIEDTLTHQTRRQQADPLTNFNMLVLDQNLPNNSNVSLANTSVIRADGGRDAVVSRLYGRWRDKSNTWQVQTIGTMSQIFTENANSKKDNDLGYSYFAEVEKISGKWQYGLARFVESHNYNTNDMGFLRSPNEVSHRAELSFNQNEPVGIFNNFRLRTGSKLEYLQKPYSYVRLSMNVKGKANFKNFWSAGFGGDWRPLHIDDYFEARADDYVFRKADNYNVFVWFNTDTRKAFRLSVDGEWWERRAWDQLDNWIGLEPSLRISRKFSIDHNLNLNWHRKEIGFATHILDSQGKLTDVIMGKRYIKNTVNTFSGNYTFSDAMGIKLRVRHYWSRVRYTDFMRLRKAGSLAPTNYTGLDSEDKPIHDVNFNALTVDLVFNWQFAPGSFLKAVWKKSMISRDAYVPYTRGETSHFGGPSFGENFQNTLNTPGTDNLSLRLIYYLDYIQFKKMFK